MRTTVRLQPGLLKRAKTEAARRNTTLTALIEEGLQLALAGPVRSSSAQRISLPVSRARGGTLPGIDLDDSADLLDAMESRR